MDENFELSTQQANAAEAIEVWFNDGNVDFKNFPIFRLFGYAGTGKTTTIRHIIEKLDLDGETLFAAYTGKAAMVMRKHGLPGRTIHSLIYKPVPPNKVRCEELSKKIKTEENADTRKLLRAQLNEASKVTFTLRAQNDSELSDASLLVLDECSMVNDAMLNDLMAFKVPMLVLGDPGQLPPIEGEGALTRVKPDALLTDIHRQARGNPIIDFATRARNGISIPKIDMGAANHTSQSGLAIGSVLSANQILCGKNDTRKKINRRVRDLKGYSSLYPVLGEKLICLKNDAEEGLFNGMMVEVTEVGELADTYIELTIVLETDEERKYPRKVKALRAHFDAYHDKDALENVKWWERSDTNEFDFGYAITVHKAQGSQWENVLLWDDKFFVWDRKERKRWLYTGITRAIESITIAS